MSNSNYEDNTCGFDTKIDIIEREVEQNIKKVNERTHRLLNELNGTITKVAQKAVHNNKKKKKLKIIYFISIFLFALASVSTIWLGIYHNSKTQIVQFADKVSTKFKEANPFQSKIDVNQNSIQIKHLVDEIKNCSELNNIVNEYNNDFNIHIIKIYYLDDSVKKEYDLNKIKDHEVSLKPGRYKAIFVVSKEEIVKQGNICVEIKKRT